MYLRLITTINAQMAEGEKFPNAKIFLKSISRNSLKSKNTYGSGLAHFHRFLTETIQTIILILF